MREEQKLKKAIQKDGAETQAEILEKLKLKYPQYVATAEDKKQKSKKRRTAVFSSLAAAAVCVAVVVPCAVLLPNKDVGGSNGYRYCAQDEYETSTSEYTLRGYSEKYDNRILYFDWYDTGEELVTNYYKNKADNEILGLHESAYLPESDEVVELAVTKVNIYLAEYSSVYESKKEQSVSGHAVRWLGLNGEYKGTVENDGYRYIITVHGGQDGRLFELVEELLQKN